MKYVPVKALQKNGEKYIGYRYLIRRPGYGSGSRNFGDARKTASVVRIPVKVIIKKHDS
jgi:hypothetical protein